MKLYECMEPDFTFEDARGKLVQVVHGGFEQVNILKSNKGVTRGGHYHKICREAFYVISGSVKVCFSKNGEDDVNTFCEGECFIVFPEVVHSMYFPEKCVMLQMYDVPVEQNGEKDIYAVG